MRKDLNTNPNLKYLGYINVPSLTSSSHSKLEGYKCIASGIWMVTVTKEYDERFKCWMEHIAMSHWNSKTKRIPTWEEIVAVKREFFEDDEECIHFIPRDDEYVNLEEDCMHIFHPILEGE